jgi:hypothetical protein
LDAAVEAAVESAGAAVSDLTALPPPQAERTNNRQRVKTSDIVVLNADLDLILVISSLFSGLADFPYPALDFISV